MPSVVVSLLTVLPVLHLELRCREVEWLQVDVRECTTHCRWECVTLEVGDDRAVFSLDSQPFDTGLVLTSLCDRLELFVELLVAEIVV